MNILRDAYENIFNDSSHFYSSQFIDNENIESDKSIKFLSRYNNQKTQTTSNIKTILIADDDEDDRLFFKEALQELQIKTRIVMVKDGAELMNHLIGNGYPLYYRHS